jgi:aspartyl-tRNA(Asn)/glutamyl-tRNA(Gln) amidotransferase subunit C
MPLHKENVQRIAALARLELAPDDVQGYVDQLSRILDFVAELATVDTTGVTPMAHPLELPARLRPDEVTEQVDRTAAQGIAPEIEDGLYLVPKVVE